MLLNFRFVWKKAFGLYDNFGSRISAQSILDGKFHQYDAFFAYGHADVEDYDEIRPAGNYLQTFCIGDWDKLQEVYQSTFLIRKNIITLYTGIFMKKA